MEVEVIKFFVIDLNEKNNTLTGSMTIRLPALGGLCILGISVSKGEKNTWFFNIPSKSGIHHETGKPVRYPIVAFEDREQQKSLMEAIKREGRSFIEERLSYKEIPLLFIHKPQKATNKAEHAKTIENPIASKETAPITKSKSSMQEWVDPPKRKQAPRKVKTYGK